MISINTVRNSVLFILNKSNRGYIGVEEFNYFCQLSQLEIFENLFEQYNKQINKDNKRLTGTEYANLPKNIREQIDAFAAYSTPSNFTFDEITGLWSYIDADLYRAEGLSLVNIDTDKYVDVEEVLKSQLNILKNNVNTVPSLLFPVYVRLGESFKVSPEVPAGYNLELFYIRKPKDPKWTYTNVGGNPMYNPSALDKQDIELHPSQLVPLVTKILAYAGLSIREQEVEQFANSEEVKDFQMKQ